MELRIKKRMVGFLLLIALGLILVPLFFGRSITSDQLSLSSRVPDRPEKPAQLAMSIPSNEATVPDVELSPVPQSTSSKSSSRIVFEQVPAANLANATATAESNKPTLTTPSQPSTHQPIFSPQLAEQPPIPLPEAVTNNVPIAIAPTPSKPTASTAKPAAIAPAVVSTPQNVTATKPEAWVVQVGSFSDKANAEALVNKIQAAGFPAYLTALSTSKGNSVRVFVGPELLKSAANAMQAKLVQSLNITGIVVRATK